MVSVFKALSAIALIMIAIVHELGGLKSYNLEFLHKFPSQLVENFVSKTDGEFPMNFSSKAKITKEQHMISSSEIDNLQGEGNGQYTLFRHNTELWLHGAHLSNRIENQAFIWDQILGIHEGLDHELRSFQTLIDNSICHKAGRFRAVSSKYWNVNDTDLIQDWTFRLIYLAIHSWHHDPAESEAKLRKEHDERNVPHSTNETLLHSIKPYDFECPNTNFLISSVPHMGFGASIRLGMVNTMAMAIASDRVPLFLNGVNSTRVSNILSEKLTLVGCTRGDIQCSFLPITPCVITLEDLENRTIELPNTVSRALRRKGYIPDKNISQERYVFTESKVIPIKDSGIYDRIKVRLYRKAVNLVDNLRQNPGLHNAQVLEVLNAALENFRGLKMVNVRRNDLNYTYQNRHSMIHHAILLYALRMHPTMKDKVEDRVHEVIMKSNDFVADRTIGLPIRASDKCDRESTCLSFDSYMQLADELKNAHFGDEGNVSVIITTEASDIARKSREISNNRDFKNFSIVMNDGDILQDSGRPRSSSYRSQASEVMISSMVALKLQLHSKIMVGNCCSNFHLVLFDLANNGCGLSESTQCLQETSNPNYHVCCQWTRTEECNKRRSQ
jgi:hypothetical protein